MNPKDMTGAADSQQPMTLDQFDPRSGSFTERLIFNHRFIVILLCVLATFFLGWQLRHLQLNASFEKTVPTQHPYLIHYADNKDELAGQGNALRIAVENLGGDIYDPAYLETLKQISDEVFLIPGVDRPFMKSLCTSSTRWMAITEEGLDGGPVMPDDYDGSKATLEALHHNVDNSGEIGRLVGLDGKSSIIYVALLALDTQTGLPIDYAQLSARLEQIRDKYRSDKVGIHIIGFAKVVGDLIDGLEQILLFFLLAVIITGGVLYAYTRCLRSTALVLSCSLVAIIWQLGMLPLVGLQLDPYSVLVPFLVFAIGISHGAQKMNGIMQDIGKGTHRLVAARFTFRRLFLTGLTALLCDAVGFGVLTIIQIQIIQDLAMVASIGVATLIFTNLILLPVFLSFVGVSPVAARKSYEQSVAETDTAARNPLWQFLDRFTQRRWATVALIVAAVLAGGGFVIGRGVQIGDLDRGAPELRADSRYNQDNDFITRHYASTSDVLVVMVKTPTNQCTAYSTLKKVDALEWQLRNLPGVESTASLSSVSRQALVGMNEGNPKWYDLSHNQGMLNAIATNTPRSLFNQDCNLLSLFVYLSDHKANTLKAVTQTVEAYARTADEPEVKFLLAAGSAGFEAATNQVVEKANHEMLLWVYAAVTLLCLATFRSWRATVCAIVPLVLTSILCEALMVMLGMGIKVATLPVIALGVGIGVDYALYVMSVLVAHKRQGHSLSASYYQSLVFTGKVVMLTGATLACAVFLWIFSPIKFQADMGVLLAFMFLLNMLGALILLPALAHFMLPDAPDKAASPEAENGRHDRIAPPPAAAKRQALV
ncbi:RND family transporter [Pseudomonas sp. NPDC088368]|uniref:efflux RND transporter permease subunit n=1 Tax=Pseudomonas sp. NPDC088368 TaxID=3364453 RepID=UPI0037F64471